MKAWAGRALKRLARLVVRLPVVWRAALWIEDIGTDWAGCGCPDPEGDE